MAGADVPFRFHSFPGFRLPTHIAVTQARDIISAPHPTDSVSSSEGKTLSILTTWTRSTRSFASTSDVRMRVLLLKLLHRARPPPPLLWCTTQAARTPGHLRARATPALPPIPPWVPSRTSRAGRKAIFSRAEAVRTADEGASRWRRRHALRAVGCGLYGGCASLVLSCLSAGRVLHTSGAHDMGSLLARSSHTRLSHLPSR
jgi:hypothetical protein